MSIEPLAIGAVIVDAVNLVAHRWPRHTP